MGAPVTSSDDKNVDYCLYGCSTNFDMCRSLPYYSWKIHNQCVRLRNTCERKCFDDREMVKEMEMGKGRKNDVVYKVKIIEF